MRIVLAMAATLVLLATTASAQTPAAQRAAELEAVARMLSDPDPMLRQATMEEIVNSGDRRKIGIAISHALRSNDRVLRGMGMTAYMAQHSKIEFDVTYPGSLEAQFQSAQFDLKKLRAFFAQAFKIGDSFLERIYQNGRKFNIAVEPDADYVGGKSFVLIGSRRFEGDLRINGDRAEMFFPEFQMGSSNWRGCSVRISPTGDGAIAGGLRCGALEYPIRHEVR